MIWRFLITVRRDVFGLGVGVFREMHDEMMNRLEF